MMPEADHRREQKGTADELSANALAARILRHAQAFSRVTSVFVLPMSSRRLCSEILSSDVSGRLVKMLMRLLSMR